jgi:hypothetical protein
VSKQSYKGWHGMLHRSLPFKLSEMVCGTMYSNKDWRLTFTQASNDSRPRERIGFYITGGGRKEVDAVLDTQCSFSIVSKRLIQPTNPWSSSTSASIEDSLGNRYTRIGIVRLTWFRPGRPTTFPVDFAVVEEDLDIIILGRQACEDAKIRRELELYPFGLALRGGKTQDEVQRQKEQEKDLHKKREEQTRAQAASEQQRRIREQQAAHTGPTSGPCNPHPGGYGQTQSECRSQQSSSIQPS